MMDEINVQEYEEVVMNRRSLPLFSLPYWPPDQLRKPVTQKETLSLTQEQTLLK